MSELTRFRIARAPLALDGSQLNAVRYPTEIDASKFPCNEPKGGAVPQISEFLKTPDYIAQPVVTEPTCQEAAPEQLEPARGLLLAIARFAAWLQAAAGRRDANAIKEWLRTNATPLARISDGRSEFLSRLVSSDQWRQLRVMVGDSLIAAVVSGSQSQAAYLASLFRAISVLEMLEAGPADTAAIAQAAVRRLILLPPWIVPARADLRGLPGGPLFARHPAFSDLIVVREEWSCFVAGEIAHIENVMSGELKKRSHERLEETENKEQAETTSSTSEERDNQSTERVSLKEETENQTHFQVHVDGQVDTSGQYGPTHVETHLGAQLSYSTDAVRRRANEQSKEIVNRATSKIEQRVQRLRSTRRLTRITEVNHHEFDNTGESREHVTGIYRWVDRIVRLQTFRYRHRFLLEFEVPEPAAYVRWARKNAPDPEVLLPPPPPFEFAPRVPLAPEHVTRDSYKSLIGRFGASGVLPPPDAEITVGAAASLNTEGPPEGRDHPIEFAPRMSTKLELTIPQNYRAVSARASIGAHPTLGRWRDQPDDSGDGYIGAAGANALGYHAVKAAFNFGGEVLQFVTPGPNLTVRGDVHPRGPGLAAQPHLQYQQAWTTVAGDFPRPRNGSYGMGKLDVGVIVGGAYDASVSVSVQCALEQSAFASWQLETYDRLHDAHRAASDAYREARNAAHVQREHDITERSPGRNAETVREELKRQVIELMLKQTLRGFDLKADDPVQGRVNRLAESAAVAPLIQFIEQAFEWSNMTYILYPYYWANERGWQEMQALDGVDADFVRFLRSGSARVIVPARPNFETAVMYFANFGEPWLGDAPPIPGDPLYISVAQEIQEMHQAPDDGEPGDLWEERLPTTLVWLDRDSALPKRNDHRTLRGTPLIDLCGA